MLEKDIERRGGEHAKQRNVLHLKLVSPGHNSLPDRLLLAPIPEFLRPLIAKYVRMVEYKQKGKKPTPAQEREHTRLRALGITVDVIDTVDDARRVVDGMGDV